MLWYSTNCCDSQHCAQEKKQSCIHWLANRRFSVGYCLSNGDPAAFSLFMSDTIHLSSIVNKTILYNGQVAGNIAKFTMFGQPEIGYWIGKEFWGKGIATQALAAFLKTIPIRPIFAAAAKDNLGSLRVLQKCGFVITGYD